MAADGPAMFRISIPTLELAMSRGTEDVPADGRYHVIADGVIIASAKSKQKALAIYRERRDQLIAAGAELPEPAPQPDAQKRLQQERTDSAIRAMRGDWLTSMQRETGRKGGRGGRGGV